MLSAEKAERTVRELYGDNWVKFKDSPTVEFQFLGKTPEQQSRLNRFKLWHFEHGGVAAMDLHTRESGRMLVFSLRRSAQRRIGISVRWWTVPMAVGGVLVLRKVSSVSEEERGDQ